MSKSSNFEPSFEKQLSSLALVLEKYVLADAISGLSIVIVISFSCIIPLVSIEQLANMSLYSFLYGVKLSFPISSFILLSKSTLLSFRFIIVNLLSALSSNIFNIVP